VLLLLCAGLRMGGGVAVPTPPTPPPAPLPAFGGGGTSTFLSNTSIRRRNRDLYEGDDALEKINRSISERRRREVIDIAVAVLLMDED
jgi:hypothetical protein